MTKGELMSDLEDEGVRGSLGGGLRGPLQAGSFSQKGDETWFWNLGRDSPVLGRGSREGSRLG